MRKTIEVKSLVDKVNRFLRTDLPQDQKQAVATLLETVLHETGNYNGFSYNFTWSLLPEDEAKAIQYNREYYYK